MVILEGVGRGAKEGVYCKEFVQAHGVVCGVKRRHGVLIIVCVLVGIVVVVMQSNGAMLWSWWMCEEKELLQHHLSVQLLMIPW